MGFKKGRAARAAAIVEAGRSTQPDDERLNIQHDGGVCLTYTASNGSEYSIDVREMIQTNTKKGTRRPVFRHQGHGKMWTMWQFETARAEGRNYTHSKHTYVQYPKWVGFALDERWRALQSSGGAISAFVAPWRDALVQLDDTALLWKLESLELPAISDPDDIIDVTARSADGEDLRAALLDRAVLVSAWPTPFVVRWLRCLLRHGLRPSPTQCRDVALARGSLALLRVLLVEAAVDVRGLVLLEPGVGQAVSKRAGAKAEVGGWVQQSKASLKVLLARGAILGTHSSKSKLLKRLEEDGDHLWAARVLDQICVSRPWLPEFMFQRVREFLGMGYDCMLEA